MLSHIPVKSRIPVNDVKLLFFLLSCAKCLYHIRLRLLVLDSFRLVATDATGIAQPLPTELRPLPLYQDGDHFYSVLGPSLSDTIPQDQNNGSADGTLAYNCINTLATLSPPRDRVFCGSSKCPGNRLICPSGMLYTCPSSTNPEKRSAHLLPSLLHP